MAGDVPGFRLASAAAYVGTMMIDRGLGLGLGLGWLGLLLPAASDGDGDGDATGRELELGGPGPGALRLRLELLGFKDGRTERVERVGGRILVGCYSTLRD
jgi:hypothetical protein